MGLYLVRSEIAPKPPRNSDAQRRHGERVNAVLRAAGLPAEWRECRTSWVWPGVLDLIEAPDERTAREAADLIVLANAEEAA
jgi:hypothetical protein